jgi:hypothetical protein
LIQTKPNKVQWIDKPQIHLSWDSWIHTFDQSGVILSTVHIIHLCEGFCPPLYSAALAYRDEALRDMFDDGLKWEIKDMMLSQNFDPTGTNTTFQNVSDQALEIDTRLMAYN